MSESLQHTCYAITVVGRVQGVWFRKSTQEKATELGLSGFVRNTPDGSVYIKAYGHGDACNQLITWCRQGPPLARVARVTAEEVDESYTGDFEVRR